MELSSFGKQKLESLPQPCGANPAFNSFSKATCPTSKSLCVMLLSPAAGHHTYTVHWHAQASTVTKEGGEVGSGGWFWEVESEQRATNPDPRWRRRWRRKKRCMCVNGGEERRIGTVGWGLRKRGEVEGVEGREGGVRGVRAANTAVERG